jgi:hypothetical protein
MTTQAAQFVGSIPEHYDSGLGPHLSVGYAEDIARRVAHLGPAPGPERVLELAAPTCSMSGIPGIQTRLRKLPTKQ